MLLVVDVLKVGLTWAQAAICISCRQLFHQPPHVQHFVQGLLGLPCYQTKKNRGWFSAIQEHVELAGECQNGFDMISLNRRVSSFKLIISFSYVSQSEFSTPAPSGVPGRLEDSRLGATVKPLCYTFRVVYFKLPASSRRESCCDVIVGMNDVRLGALVSIKIYPPVNPSVVLHSSFA